MAFVIFRLEVQPVLHKRPLDLVGRKHPERCSGRKVCHSGKGRLRSVGLSHGAILLRNANDGTISLIGEDGTGAHSREQRPTVSGGAPHPNAAHQTSHLSLARAIGKPKFNISSVIVFAWVFDFYAHASDKWDVSENQSGAGH